MGLELSILLVILGSIGIVLAVRRGRRGGPSKPPRQLWRRGSARSYRPWDQEDQLLQLCRGDREMADRLIARELERAPNLSRAGAALAAATRLRHDQR